MTRRKILQICIKEQRENSEEDSRKIVASRDQVPEAGEGERPDAKTSPLATFGVMGWV